MIILRSYFRPCFLTPFKKWPHFWGPNFAKIEGYGTPKSPKWQIFENFTILGPQNCQNLEKSRSQNAKIAKISIFAIFERSSEDPLRGRRGVQKWPFFRFLTLFTYLGLSPNHRFQKWPFWPFLTKMAIWPNLHFSQKSPFLPFFTPQKYGQKGTAKSKNRDLSSEKKWPPKWPFFQVVKMTPPKSVTTFQNAHPLTGPKNPKNRGFKTTISEISVLRWEMKQGVP